MMASEVLSSLRGAAIRNEQIVYSILAELRVESWIGKFYVCIRIEHGTLLGFK
jgi:hypothetical protein